MTFTVRPAGAGDMADIFRVRTSVRENHLTEDQLAYLGVTPASLAGSIAEGAMEAWCSEVEGMVAGFSMIDVGKREVFALFVMPAFEGAGIGSALLDVAVARLFALGSGPIQLSTGKRTQARSFYERRGWRVTGSNPERGDVVMTLVRPPGR